MTRQCLLIPTELQPSQRMLKPKHMLRTLPEDSDDVYATNKFDVYLRRPRELAKITYPEFFRWWRKATSQEQKTGGKLKAMIKIPCLQTRS